MRGGESGETGLRSGPGEAKEKRKPDNRFEKRRLDFMVTFDSDNVSDSVWGFLIDI